MNLVVEIQEEIRERHRSKRFTPRPLPRSHPHPELYAACLHCAHSDTDGKWRCCHCNEPFDTFRGEYYNNKALFGSA